jgi:hypothetical protein
MIIILYNIVFRFDRFQNYFGNIDCNLQLLKVPLIVILKFKISYYLIKFTNLIK